MNLFAVAFITGASALDAAAGPVLTAASAVIMDAESGKVLFAKNPDVTRFPASTTKMMTGLLLLENTLPTDIITAPKDVMRVRQSSMHMKPGEKISSRDLLKAIMLRSANDGAYAAAIHVSKSVPAFSALMNKRAREMGATHTNFHNPNGLNDPLHLTTARDLANMGREAMRNDAFREVVGLPEAVIARSVNQRDRSMKNRNKELRVDPTLEGIKTGWTIPAGHCFVGSTTRNGFRLVNAILKSEDWPPDHRAMMAWAYGTFAPALDVAPGTEIGEFSVPGASGMVRIAPRRRVLVIGRRAQPPTWKIEFVPEDGVALPAAAGTRLGVLRITDSDGFNQEVPAENLDPVEPGMAAALFGDRFERSKGLFAFGGALFLGAYAVRHRARRRTAQYGA